MTSVSPGHIILTPTQPVGSGRPQLGSNPGPPDQELRALPTELPRPPLYNSIDQFYRNDIKPSWIIMWSAMVKISLCSKILIIGHTKHQHNDHQLWLIPQSVNGHDKMPAVGGRLNEV